MWNNFDKVQHKYYDCRTWKAVKSKSNSYEIDSNIADAIQLLNLKGYSTFMCCEGHMSMDSLRQGLPVDVCICFDSPIAMPDGFNETRLLHGRHCYECFVVPSNKYKEITRNNTPFRGKHVKLTNELYETEVSNLKKTWESLYNWADSLPYKK